MSGRLETIAIFGSPGEARIAVSRLLDAGIAAHLDGEISGSALSYMGSGLGGVKLQVAEEDVERACTLLEAAAEEPADTSPWKCPGCGTKIEHGFDVCWSCGYEREPAAARGSAAPQPVEDEPQTPCPMCGSPMLETQTRCENCGERTGTREVRAFRGTRTGSDDLALSPAREILHRAWKASILGWALCPPLLHIYSTMLLMSYQDKKARDGSDDDWRAKASLCVNVVAITGALALLFVLFRPR